MRVKAKTRWQVAPAGSVLALAMVVVGQSEAEMLKGGGILLVPPSTAGVKVWADCPRLVMVRVRRMGALVAVWMPKSSSVGEKTRGVGFVPDGTAGRAAVWAVALAAETVREPGPEPVRAMAQSAPAGRVAVQVVLIVKPVAVIWRLVAWAEPRLRRVMSGAAPVERASEGAAVPVVSLAR